MDFRCHEDIGSMDLHVEYEIAIQRMINFFAEFLKKVKACSPPKKWIEDLEAFQILFEKEIRTTPMMQHAYEIKICSSREDLKRAVKDVQHLQALMEEETLKFEDFKKEMNVDIAREESSLRMIEKITEESIVDEKIKSDEKILATREKYRVRIELLKKKINSFVARVELIYAENAAAEKEIRKIRSQTGNRSVELLAKYDRDIGAKYRLFEKLTHKNSTLKEEQKELNTRLKNQYESYIQLKEEREQAIMKAFLVALENFKRNRAAKVIQRTWRCYHERLLLKKKKKSKKK